MFVFVDPYVRFGLNTLLDVVCGSTLGNAGLDRYHQSILCLCVKMLNLISCCGVALKLNLFSNSFGCDVLQIHRSNSFNNK